MTDHKKDNDEILADATIETDAQLTDTNSKPRKKPYEEDDYNIYSNSNKADDGEDFSLELEIERSRMAEREAKDSKLKSDTHMHIFQDAEKAQGGTPAKSSFSSKNFKKAINGISYKTLKRKRSLSHVLLNNGEPLPFALRSMFLQFGALALCTIAILVCVIGFNFFTNSGENISLSYFSISKDYQAAVSTDAIQPVPSSRADISALNTIFTWAGVAQTQIADTPVLLTPKTIESQLGSTLIDYDVTLKEGLSNYDLIAQIYESLEQKIPVLVSCTSNFSVIASEASISYALVTAIDTNQSLITIIDETGMSRQVSFDAFIASTRFDNIENQSFSDTLNFLFGNYAKNTAIFLTK